MTRVVVASLVLASALFGCSEGKRPFLMAQICLRDEQNLSAFTQELRSISQSENMRFVDGSRESERELNALGHEASGRLIHMAVESENGVGLTAGNLGLPTYQAVIGFSEGSNPDGARAFAGRVISKISQRWHVETIPSEHGAQPMEDCI